MTGSGSAMTEIVIQTREKTVINTDPQRRCYNGCNFSEEIVWTPWVDLCTATEESVERRLKFWKELNDYAVSQRGEGARREFRVQRRGESDGR
jgi:hypothetical protein